MEPFFQLQFFIGYFTLPNYGYCKVLQSYVLLNKGFFITFLKYKCQRPERDGWERQLDTISRGSK